MNTEKQGKESPDKIGRYGFLSEPFRCDFTGCLSMSSLGNHLLNAADFHSHDRGFGLQRLQAENKTWVLSRLVMEMTKMPAAYSDFFVETWVESAMRYFTHRNFKVEDVNSGVCGYGRSVWAMIDTDSRQPVNLFEVRDGALMDYVCPEVACPIDIPSRVKMGSQSDRIATIVASYGDIDVNGHVNSVKYIEHVLNLFPVDYYKTFALRRIEMVYCAESYAGNYLHFYREQTGEHEFRVRITREEASKEGQETEVCRSLLQFCVR